MVEVIAPAAKPLVSDRANAVKEQCFTAVAGWLGASRCCCIVPSCIRLSASLVSGCRLNTLVDLQAKHSAGYRLTRDVGKPTQVSHDKDIMLTVQLHAVGCCFELAGQIEKGSCGSVCTGHTWFICCLFSYLG